MVSLNEKELRLIITRRLEELSAIHASIINNMEDDVEHSRKKHRELSRAVEDIGVMLFELKIVQELDKEKEEKEEYNFIYKSPTGGIATNNMTIVGEDLSLRVVFPAINKEVKSDPSKV